MAEAGKRLGAVTGATAETSLYVVPGATFTVMGTLTICNRTTAKVTYRWAIVAAGGAAADADWKEYDTELLGNESAFRTLGEAMESGSEIRVQSSVAGVSFSASGIEYS